LSFMLTLVTSDESPYCVYPGHPHGGCGIHQDCVYVKDKVSKYGRGECWYNEVCTQSTLDIGQCTTCRNSYDETLCTPTGERERCLLDADSPSGGPMICVTCNRTCESGRVCTFEGGMQKCKYPTTSTATTVTTATTATKPTKTSTTAAPAPKTTSAPRHFGGIKRIVFDDPLKQIKQGKIRYSYQDNGSYYGDEGLAKAFEKDFSADEFGWYARECPQLLWCKFDDAKVPGGITFLPSQVKQWATLIHVTKWQFLASKDSKCNQDATWEVICEDLSGTVDGNIRAEKGCFAGEKIQEKYKCFGIRVLEAESEVGKYDTYDDFILTNINMYEKTSGYT